MSKEPGYAAEIARWREILIAQLKGRPEGFVVDGRLARLDGPSAPFLPGFEQDYVGDPAVVNVA